MLGSTSELLSSFILLTIPFIITMKGPRICSGLYNTSKGSRPASYPTGIGGSYTARKAVGT